MSFPSSRVNSDIEFNPSQAVQNWQIDPWIHSARISIWGSGGGAEGVREEDVNNDGNLAFVAYPGFNGGDTTIFGITAEGGRAGGRRQSGVVKKNVGGRGGEVNISAEYDWTNLGITIDQFNGSSSGIGTPESPIYLRGQGGTLSGYRADGGIGSDGNNTYVSSHYHEFDNEINRTFTSTSNGSLFRIDLKNENADGVNGYLPPGGKHYRINFLQPFENNNWTFTITNVAQQAAGGGFGGIPYSYQGSNNKTASRVDIWFQTGGGGNTFIREFTINATGTKPGGKGKGGGGGAAAQLVLTRQNLVEMGFNVSPYDQDGNPKSFLAEIPVQVGLVGQGGAAGATGGGSISSFKSRYSAKFTDPVTGDPDPDNSQGGTGGNENEPSTGGSWHETVSGYRIGEPNGDWTNTNPIIVEEDLEYVSSSTSTSGFGARARVTFLPWDIGDGDLYTRVLVEMLNNGTGYAVGDKLTIPTWRDTFRSGAGTPVAERLIKVQNVTPPTSGTSVAPDQPNEIAKAGKCVIEWVETPQVYVREDSSKTLIVVGQTARLKWTVEGDADTLTWPGADFVNGIFSGQQDVSPTVTTTYTAQATGVGGTSSNPESSYTIEVAQIPTINDFASSLNVSFGDEKITLTYDISYCDVSAEIEVYYNYTEGPNADDSPILAETITIDVTNVSYDADAVAPKVTGLNNDVGVDHTITWGTWGPTSITATLKIIGTGSQGIAIQQSKTTTVLIDKTPDELNIPETEVDKGLNPIYTPDTDVLTEMLLLDDIDVPVEIKADQPIQVMVNNNAIWENVRQI